jgi:hypothetical protein
MSDEQKELLDSIRLRAIEQFKKEHEGKEPQDIIIMVGDSEKVAHHIERLKLTHAVLIISHEEAKIFGSLPERPVSDIKKMSESLESFQITRTHILPDLSSIVKDIPLKNSKKFNSYNKNNDFHKFNNKKFNSKKK